MTIVALVAQGTFFAKLAAVTWWALANCFAVFINLASAAVLARLVIARVILAAINTCVLRRAIAKGVSLIVNFAVSAVLTVQQKAGIIGLAICAFVARVA